MPKIITPAALQVIQQRTRIPAVVVVSVLWGFDLRWYTSRQVQIPGINALPWITEFSEVNCEKRTDARSSTGALSFTLDDSDGQLKFYVDNVLIEKAKATAWLWLDGTGFNDRILLLDGHLTSPSWDDKTRSLSLGLETAVEKEEFGFAATKQDFKDLDDEAVGVAWPMAFGTVSHVPALRVRKKTEASLAADIVMTGQGYYKKTKTSVKLDNDTKPHILSYIPDETLEGKTADNVLFIDHPERFPTNEIILNIDNVLFKGKFIGEAFKVSQVNYPKYQNIKLTIAKESKEGREEADPNDDYWRSVAVPDGVSLANCFCYFDDNVFNYCTRQIDSVATFQYAFIDKQGRPFWPKTLTFAFAIADNGTTNHDIARQFGMLTLQGTHGQPVMDIFKKVSQSPGAFWRKEMGTQVTLYDAQDPDIYIVSGVTFNRIDGVYGKMTVKSPDGKDRKILTSLPKPYYEKKLSSNVKVNKVAVSGLILKTPLSEYIGQGWEDQIYVSGRSILGPNAARIIEYILENFTDLDLNHASFDFAASKVEDTPCNFAIFDRRNALQLAQEIAWQSRCVILVDSDSVSLKYLAETPSPIMSFNESNIDEDSIQIGFTSINDIVTRYSGTWTESYKDAPQPQSLNINAVRELSRVLKSLLPDTYKERTATQVYTRRENIDKFGLSSEDTNIYIYNDEDSVIKTVNFWGHRKANSWTKLRFRPLNLDAMILQPYDGVAINVNSYPFAINTIGEVESARYNHKDKTITLDVWLPILAGHQTVDSGAFNGGI